MGKLFFFLRIEEWMDDMRCICLKDVFKVDYVLNIHFTHKNVSKTNSMAGPNKHRFNSDSVPAHSGMFTGVVLILVLLSQNVYLGHKMMLTS